jgi:hypothetical protein
LPERGGFFFEWTLTDESVMIPAGLMLRGGEDGGVLSVAGCCVCGVVIFFDGFRWLLVLAVLLLFRAPLGVGSWGVWVDMMAICFGLKNRQPGLGRYRRKGERKSKGMKR